MSTVKLCMYAEHLCLNTPAERIKSRVCTHPHRQRTATRHSLHRHVAGCGMQNIQEPTSTISKFGKTLAAEEDKQNGTGRCVLHHEGVRVCPQACIRWCLWGTIRLCVCVCVCV